MIRALLVARGRHRFIARLELEPASDWGDVPVSTSTTRYTVITEPLAAYPIFVFQDDAGFRFRDCEGAARELRAMATPEEGREAILFVFREAFRAEDDRDEMGAIPHCHLDARGLASSLEELA